MTYHAHAHLAASADARNTLARKWHMLIAYRYARCL
jgi:hypothetical protein